MQKSDKKHFNKNLVMSEKDEQMFQSNKKCRICDDLFSVVDNKVRDHCHITRNIEVLVIGVVILTLH